jgi:outer membrane protein assembly complex protein YaeT
LFALALLPSSSLQAVAGGSAPAPVASSASATADEESPKATAAASWGLRVVSIRLQCERNLDIDDYLPVIAQKIGEPLDKSKVAESLKNLYATGRFAELRADAEPVAGGVNLIFLGRCQYFVGVVRVEGAPGTLESRALVNAARLRLGQPLTEEDLAEAQKHLAELLAANAYYRVRIERQIQPNPDTQEANVVLAVWPGPAARLNGVEFQGQTVFPPARLLAVAGWHNGMRLSSARLERGLFRIHHFFVAHDRLQATVSMSKRVYDSNSNTEKLLVQTQAGPLIQVHVEGAHLRRSKLKDLVPIFRDGVVDDPALARSERGLESYFQQEGYLSASAKGERKAGPDSEKLDITFHIKLGNSAEFVGYGVRGNRSVPAAELMAALSAPAQGLFPPPPAYTRELVEQKKSALLALYRSKGFLDAQVTPAIDEHYGHQSGHWFVNFQITEGPQTTVRNLTLTGADPGTEKELWSSLLCRPGQPYSPERALADRDTLRDYLADRGYTQASITWDATPALSELPTASSGTGLVQGEHRVDLVYRIEPGPQERIHRIVVLGNQHTRTGVIRRELVIHNGEPLSQGALLDSQRQLYEMGVFNQVQITSQDPRGSEANKTILVGVEEGRRWTLGYGGGLEVQRLGSNNPQGQFKASPRVSVDATRLDVGGRAQTFTLRGQLSDIERGGGLTYLIPRLLERRDLTLRINGLVDRSRDVLTFTADRREASVSIEKRFSPSTLILARYSFRRVLALDISNRIQPQDLPLVSQPARVGGLAASYVSDRRDDPADSTRGSYSLADAGIAWRNLGSEADFLRFTGQNATYYKLGTHLVFARNTRFAVESPFGGLRKVSVSEPNKPPEILFTHDIPLPERFFMGGSESHRGFSINQAGPRDPTTGFPVGGNALFFNSLELRVPLAERRLAFALFHDAGNVYSTIRKMRLLKFDQSSPTDFDYTVHAVGMGVRYKTPVGPLRFDVGCNLNPPRFQVVSQQNNIESAEVRRLSPFQFFLSIGQSF